jgi:hypothetical protein
MRLWWVNLVGEHLAWSHGAEDQVLTFPLEAIVVVPAIVEHATIILPRAAQENVAYGHGHHVAYQSVFIGADLERNFHGMIHLDGAGVTKPLDLVRVRVLLFDEVELGAKFFTCQVVATTAINDDFDGAALYTRLGVEDVASLVLIKLLLEGQHLGDHKGGTRVIVTIHMSVFVIIGLGVMMDLNQSFHLAVTYGVVLAIVFEDHGALGRALKCLVTTSFAREALNRACLCISWRKGVGWLSWFEAWC